MRFLKPINHKWCKIYSLSQALNDQIELFHDGFTYNIVAYNMNVFK